MHYSLLFYTEIPQKMTENQRCFVSIIPSIIVHSVFKFLEIHPSFQNGVVGGQTENDYRTLSEDE